MRSVYLEAFLVMTIAGALPSVGMAATDTFEKDKIGAMPEGWSAAITGAGVPKWSVQKEDSAPSGQCVLKQSAWTANPSFPICIKPDVSMKDGFVEVKVKPLSGTNDQAAGLVWRYRDSQNYYVARANALENNVVLYKVKDGKRTALDIVGRTGGYGVREKVPSQQWSMLRIDFAGEHFRVSLNGKELFAVEDGTFSEAGAVGVWTKADSVTLFDDFSYGRSPQ